MSCSDDQMIIASQIAYYDFDINAVNAGIYTVRELLEMEIESGNASDMEKAQRILNLINENSRTEACGNWVIRSVRNDQHGSGMYACLLDMGNEQAMIAFRGSESDTLENVVKDWVVSDFGLLNSVLTPQQMAAEKYVRDIYRQYGDEFTSFDLTGHSLGGNLAEHATITAPDGMREKIGRCVNMDGPGYSNLYMEVHAEDIEKSKHIIDHYQWSWCGSLLNPIPGSNYQTVYANEPEDGGVIKKYFWKHDTKNVTTFDKNGNMLPAPRDLVTMAISSFAQSLDMSLFTMVSLLMPELMFNRLDRLKDELETLWRQWEIYRNSWNADMEFEVSWNRVALEMEQIQNISEKLQVYSEAVANIQKQLPFRSAVTGYVKYRLWNETNKIQNYSNKAAQYAEAGENCARQYQTSESQIAGNYGV